MAINKHSHYFRDITGYKKLDVYRLLALFNVTDPCAQHIAKKAIACGERGHKDLRRDLQDIIDTAQRRLEMLDEDAEIQADPAVMVYIGGQFVRADELGVRSHQDTLNRSIKAVMTAAGDQLYDKPEER